MSPEQREIRKLRRELKGLISATTTALKFLDVEMRQPSTHERGKRIARLCNFLEMAKDSARHFGLDEKL